MTNWMPAGRLAKARRRQEEAMPDTCTIRRKTITYAGPGDATVSTSDTADVSCRIAPGRGSVSEDVLAEAVRGRTWWLLRLAHDQDIQRDDQVIIGGETYEVVGILDVGSWITAKKAVLVEVD